MKNFYIIANTSKTDVWETAEALEGYLKSRGASCQVQQQNFRESSGRYTDPAQVPGEIDCVITIGGDGTLIQAARDLAGRQIPLIGINRGHLGYLTQVSRREDIREMADCLLSGRFQVEERMMISGRILRNGRELFRDIALNEIVLTFQTAIRVLRFGVYVNDSFLNEYTADGLIVATPTGSTAYNLSAGGPIVSPEADVVVLTPICSHALNARSIVLPAKNRLCIEIQEGKQAAVFDGDMTVELEPGDQLLIERSGQAAPLIRLKQISFLQNLSNKLAGF